MFCLAGEDVYLNYKGSVPPQSNKTFPSHNESKDSPPEIHEIASAEANSIQKVAFEPVGSA